MNSYAMEENGRRRNPLRKASRALRPLNTNSVNIKLQKSQNEAILADDSQEQKNEGSAITSWTNDDSRKENM